MVARPVLFLFAAAPAPAMAHDFSGWQPVLAGFLSLQLSPALLLRKFGRPGAAGTHTYLVFASWVLAIPMAAFSDTGWPLVLLMAPFLSPLWLWRREHERDA